MKYSTIFFIFLSLAPVASIAETLENVTIEEIRVRSQGTNSIVKFSSKFNNLCQDNGSSGILRTYGTEGVKLAWSALMTAYAAGKSITILTNDDCDYHNVIREVRLLK